MRIQQISTAALPNQLGGLLQSAICQSLSRVALPRLLHSPHRHLQSTIAFLSGWKGKFLLEGLRTQQSSLSDETISRGVYPTLPDACSSCRFCPNPPLRHFCQPTPSKKFELLQTILPATRNGLAPNEHHHRLLSNLSQMQMWQHALG